MSRLVVTGAWTIETNNKVGSDILGSQPVASRLTYLEKVLKHFDQFCTTVSAWRHYSEGVLYIFVAPEYYFKSSNIDVERCLSKDERDTILETLTKLSRVYDHTVIVPGTIIWHKPADDKARKKAQVRLRDGMQAQGIKADLLPKWQALSFPGQVQSVSYNSAYIFYDGSIYKYHKMNDAIENQQGDLAKGILFIPGSRPGYFPNLGGTGLNFGIEICADHQAGVLNQTVDIHILSSASTNTNQAMIRARHGGLFVHASSGHTTFYVNNAGKFEAPPAATIPFNATDFLTGEQLDAQKTAMLSALGPNPSQGALASYNKKFQMNATQGQLDCWVTVLN